MLIYKISKKKKKYKGTLALDIILTLKKRNNFLCKDTIITEARFIYCYASH